MADALSIGVEEEFQIVDNQTAELVSGVDAIMAAAPPALLPYLKQEFAQPVIESVTSPCADIPQVYQETLVRRATLAQIADDLGWSIISAGTHPTSLWYHQKRSLPKPGEADRYAGLDALMQDLSRSVLVYGLHVHIGIERAEDRLIVMNQARTFLPYILALSVNAPFWMGRFTGYMSYRPSVWAPFPTSGIPEVFPTLAEFERVMDLFARVNVIDDLRRIWWDIRLHHALPTVEFRIADMPLTHQDMLALVAYIQAIVKTILDLNRQGKPLPDFPAMFIAENRWRAARFGLSGKLVDFAQEREVPTRSLIASTLDLVSDAAQSLGTTNYIAYLRKQLASGSLTGAEQQLAVYKQNYALTDVTRFLMRQTLRNIDLRESLHVPQNTQTTNQTNHRKKPFFRRSQRANRVTL